MSRTENNRCQKKKTWSKVLFFCILLILVILLIIVESQNGERTSGSFVYTVNRGKATIVDYTGNNISLAIPASLHDYPLLQSVITRLRETTHLSKSPCEQSSFESGNNLSITVILCAQLRFPKPDRDR